MTRTFRRTLAASLLLTCISAFAEWKPAHNTDPGIHPVTDFVFAPGSASFAQCHASTLIELRHGSLLAAWFGGTKEGAPDVAIYTARFSGGHWSPPVEVAREHDGDKGIPTWNPVLFHTQDGRLWLYYKTGDNPREWSAVRISSTDEGRSWSSPERLPAGIIGPSRTKPLVLPDHLIVSGSSVEAYKAWASWIERSTDDGATWTKIGPITVTEAQDKAEPPAPEPSLSSPELREKDKGPRAFDGIIQPSVVSLGPAHLRLYARSRTLAAKIVVADSYDQGLTWTKTHFLDLPSNNSGLDAVSLLGKNNRPDGRVIMIFNDTPRGRSPLNLAISTDGEHFRVFATLEQGEGEYSYPAIIQTRNGDLEITYTWHRTAIRHVHLSFAEVPRS
ncbi:neuraminidase (sialidase) [Silvibacterium dinghuense]|uniref:Neuraminidase (Sialidase) n=2 Tax=Silvibacterium dinghuense TaxID=1560006 RepID=A0A4V1NVG6_9BACT|nr:neuraminidase (sialidase) [Silvibacterium dinghuense]